MDSRKTCRYFRKNGCLFVENIVTILVHVSGRLVVCVFMLLSIVPQPVYNRIRSEWLVIVANIASFGLKITRELQINCYRTRTLCMFDQNRFKTVENTTVHGHLGLSPIRGCPSQNARLSID